MVSEAVEEVLSLVQHATHTFKSMTSSDSDILVQGNYSLTSCVKRKRLRNDRFRLP